MTTPNLPPLPAPDVFNGNYSDGVIEAYALAAYQAGLSADFDAAFCLTGQYPANDMEGEYYAKMKSGGFGRYQI